MNTRRAFFGKLVTGIAAWFGWKQEKLISKPYQGGVLVGPSSQSLHVHHPEWERDLICRFGEVGLLRFNNQFDGHTVKVQATYIKKVVDGYSGSSLRERLNKPSTVILNGKPHRFYPTEITCWAFDNRIDWTQ